MLKQFDFSDESQPCSLSLKALMKGLGQLQRTCIERNIPVLVLVDGWETAGKGTLIQHICYELDPRYYSVAVFSAKEEESYPYLWRYWRHLPKKGHMTIFNRSFYQQAIKEGSKERIHRALEDGYGFEKTLRDDGTILVKLFLHISKKTHKERVHDVKSFPLEKKLISFIDDGQLEDYDGYEKAWSDCLKQSNYVFSPWHIISMEDKKAGTKQALQVLMHELEKGLLEKRTSLVRSHEPYAVLPPILLDLDKECSEAEYDEKLPILQKRAKSISEWLLLYRIPTVLAFEGTDAAGKGGTIKRLVKDMDPRLYDISTTAAPTAEEKSFHYLRRFMEAMPGPGRITIFDRTWYGRVLVERIEGFASQEEWRRAYREIGEMEESLIRHGVNMMKFFLVIDKDEQGRRFEARERTPEKRYKITEEDWRNREKWDSYEVAYREMLYHTSSKEAPWHIIEGNNKRYARIRVLEAFIMQGMKKLEEAAPHKKWDWEKIWKRT